MVILEDDAVIKDDFLNRLDYLLRLIEQQRYGPTEWLDLKLYSQPRLQGFAWDPQPLLELVAYSCLLGWALELLLTSAFFCRSISWRSCSRRPAAAPRLSSTTGGSWAA